MSLPSSVRSLVARFAEHIDAYRSGTYNETQVRRDFIDPFFEALGWDIDNRAGYAEAYRDVIHEDHVRVGGAIKAPDYGFRIGGQRKFFLEAKKPSVWIKDAISPAYQLRRYAWSAKLPLSVLTDFEEFAVYDTRIKPAPSDAASTARIFYCRFEEYEHHWDFIESVFSIDAIRRGSFDKYALESQGKRGTTEVDEAFLGTIEGWRAVLAKNLALRNEGLSERELNFAVQRIIDRVIFLRICEDRGIEDYGRLRSAVDAPGIYGSLVQLFEQADDRYNSGLFHFRAERGRSAEPDSITPSLAVDDSVLKPILRGLYYPESPYEFSVLGADILGQVYEQFLGKVITLSAGHRAKVVEKPEIRKSGGVYYTPTHIVDYIVERTLRPLLTGKAPSQIKNIRVLDPACGSGSFLIGAYQFLLDWHLDQYIGGDPAALARRRLPVVMPSGGGWALTVSERKRILLTHIFGVDIDNQAVEVTKLSLLLKVLEGEAAQTLQRELIRDRALPDLGANIKCGNSLVSSDFYQQPGLPELDRDAQMRVNAFDWDGRDGFPEAMRAGGFDAVIGNPPYDVMEKDRGKASWPHDVLAAYARQKPEYLGALGRKLNLFRFFVVKATLLTRPRGSMGMILPMALLADISCSTTRKFVLAELSNLSADCFPQKDNPKRRVFRGAKLSTAVVVGRRRPRRSLASGAIDVRVFPWDSFEDQPRESRVQLEETELLDPDNCPIPLVDQAEWKVCLKLHRHVRTKRLGDVADFVVTRGEINQTIYKAFINGDPANTRLLKGAEVGRYHLRRNLSQGERRWFDEPAFLRRHSSKPVSEVRRIATQRITGVDERLRVVATMVEPKCYFADSTNSIALAPSAKLSLEYLLALLNSALFQWRFRLTSTNNNVGTNELNCLPVPALRHEKPRERAAHDALSVLSSQLLDLSATHEDAKTPHERAALKRRISGLERRVDEAVYELFDLDAEDVRLIESRVGAKEET